MAGSTKAGPYSGKRRYARECRDPGRAQRFPSTPYFELEWYKRITLEGLQVVVGGRGIEHVDDQVEHDGAPSRKGPARLVEVAHTLKRAAVAVGEQVEVTPSWRRLSPFLQGYQHISLDQRSRRAVPPRCLTSAVGGLGSLLLLLSIAVRCRCGPAPACPSVLTGHRVVGTARQLRASPTIAHAETVPHVIS